MSELAFHVEKRPAVSELARWRAILSTLTIIKDACQRAANAGRPEASQTLLGAVAASEGLRTRQLGARYAAKSADESGEVLTSALAERLDVPLSRQACDQLALLERALDPVAVSEQRALMPQELWETDVRRVLFPLAVYVDELIADAMRGQEVGVQPSVQSTMFSIEDGGEQFYRELDAALLDRRPPMLLLEVFYFCLKDGFLGRCEVDDPERLRYLDVLHERIRDGRARRVVLSPIVERVVPPSPARYYGRAALACLLTALVGWGIARIEIAWFPVCDPSHGGVR